MVCTEKIEENAKNILTERSGNDKIIYVIGTRYCVRDNRNTYGGYGEAVNTADCGSVMRGFDPHIAPHFIILKNHTLL